MSNLYTARHPGFTVMMKSATEAELELYGEIVETQPVDWWTDEPIEGNWIIQDVVLSELDNVVKAGAKSIRLRINSLGGDAGVAITIHNRLRELSSEKGINIRCVVDGVAASGGSLIACACDEVEVFSSSLFMIHKCWGYMFGGYNADELRAVAKQRDAWDQAQTNIYNRKSGLSETVLNHMMSDKTYMTGKEIVDKGFADVLSEDAGVAKVAASADRKNLLVNGVKMHLAPGMVLPESIPTEQVSTEESDDINNQPAMTGTKGGNQTMATNLEELRAENPELAAQVEADVRAGLPAESDVSAAVEAERNRLREIDAIAGLYDDEAVNAAKYGEHPMTASELAFEQARAAAERGTAFAAAMLEDAKNANTVPAAGDKPDDANKEENDPQAAAKADYANYRKIKEGKR